MRPPKGFGANYFTLAAIEATVAQVYQNAIAARCKMDRRFERSANKETVSEEPPCKDEALCAPTILAIKTPHATATDPTPLPPLPLVLPSPSTK